MRTRHRDEEVVDTDARDHVDPDTRNTVDPDTRDTAVVDDRVTTKPRPVWSPAQIIGLAIGVGFIIWGIAVLARTGFDTSDVYSPHRFVWHVSHTPLLGAIDIAFGALLVIASVVPGAIRSLMALLGAVALGFGLVILLDAAPNRLYRWLGVLDRNGWIYVIVGGVLLLTAFFSPTFGGTSRRRVQSYRGDRGDGDRDRDREVVTRDV